MPFSPALEASWKFIQNQVIDIHIHWKFHEQLFGRGQKRLDLINESAPNFFYLTQEALLLAIQLKLSKLGDPASMGRHENMTLAKLRDEILSECMSLASKSSEAFIARLDACLKDYGVKSEKARERRNKILAHTDHAAAMNKLVIPLLTPTRQEIEDALALAPSTDTNS